MQVKITDNALARDLFPMDYHCLGDNENRTRSLDGFGEFALTMTSLVPVMWVRVAASLCLFCNKL